MVESAVDTADNPDNIEVIAVIDDDDTYSVTHPNLTIHQVPRTTLSEYWNIAYQKATGPIYMHCGDDIRFRTKGWDTIVDWNFEQYDDKILFLYGRDGLQDEVLGTHGFLHKNWVDAVGYFVPPYFSSDYNDTWLNEVAESIGRRVYDPRIFTEHLHPSAGRGEWDKTHQERTERHKHDKVDELYASKAGERVADAEKLRALL
jgi:hypothetical protein